MGEVVQFIPKSEPAGQIHHRHGASGGEIIRFVSRSERERARLVRGTQVIYDGIFPQANPLGVQQDKTPPGHLATSANAGRGDGILS
jgi:hypothetical protein